MLQVHGLDIAMEFLPFFEEEQERADWVVNRLVENDVKSVAEDFLEYHQQSISMNATGDSENLIFLVLPFLSLKYSDGKA